MNTPVPLIIPANACRSHAYTYDLDKIPSEITPETLANGCRIGANVDTEFKEDPAYYTIATSRVENRRGVTVQVSGALGGDELIFVHPDHAAYALRIGKTKELRHPVMRHEWVLIDYLQAHGYDITFRRCENVAYVDTLPPAYADHFAFFALAELCMIFTGECKQDIKALVLEHAITQNRRLTTRDITRCDDWKLDYCRMPWVMAIEGQEFGVRLRWIDVAGLHGVASYRDLLINTGFEVDDKDLMKDLGLITKMDEAYFSHPDEFDRYALGDLKIYHALCRNAENFKAIYEALDLGDYYKPPYLTIGKTIAQLFEAAILQHFGVRYRTKSHDMEVPLDEDTLPSFLHSQPSNENTSILTTRDSVLYHGCYFGSAAYLRKQAYSTAAILAKVFGGRCRAHRATLTNFFGILCDLDLSGCYGQGLRAQPYPFGRPVLMGFPHDSTINVFPTLQEFLNKRQYFTKQNELVPGLWTACITLPPDYELRYVQTFFPSWFGFNPRRDMNVKPQDERIIDLQEPSLEMAVDSGNTKIFHNRIDHAILTQDGLEWILYACGTAQRDELLQQLRVVSAAYYKRSDHVDTVQEFRQGLCDHIGLNTWAETRENSLTTTTTRNQECHTWTSVNLGTLLVDKLLANRQLYPKKDPVYPHPLNTLYKLIVNGLFGDMVSPFFAIGNTIVGNNITARARAACWYMETAFNGVQSITDGVQLDVNKVVYPETRHAQQRITPQDIIALRYESHGKKAGKVELRPIAGYKHLTLAYENGVKTLYCETHNNSIDTYRGKEIDVFINNATMAHMRACWPNPKISVLHAKSTSLIVKNAGTCKSTPIIEYVDRDGQFEFEMKSLYHSAAFHSTANHLLLGDFEAVAKHRSYNKRITYYAYSLVDGKLILQDVYKNESPPHVYLTALLHNPHAVPRGYAYIHNKLTKPNEYRQRYRAFFQHNILDPGDSYTTCGLFKEFSLSQLTMRSCEQFVALNKEYENSKKTYGQYIECFFANPDGTLDVARMLLEAQRHIDQGCMSLLKAFDPHDHFAHRGGKRAHPQFAALQTLRTHLEYVYGGYVNEEIDPLDMYNMAVAD